jgi:hypothetical protein
LASDGVVEKEDVCCEAPCSKAVVEATAGLLDMGIRNTLAKEASTGESDRIGASSMLL